MSATRKRTVLLIVLTLIFIAFSPLLQGGVYSKQQENESEHHTEILEYMVNSAQNEINSGAVDNLVKTAKEFFKDSLNKAKAVLCIAKETPNSITQDQINFASSNLIKAMHFLDFIKGDKTQLRNTVSLLEKRKTNKNTYISSTFIPFENAMEEARKVLNDEDALEYEVKDALGNLQNSAARLRAIPDKDLISATPKKASLKNNNLPKENKITSEESKEPEKSEEKNSKLLEEQAETEKDKPLSVEEESKKSSDEKEAIAKIKAAENKSSNAETVKTTNNERELEEDNSVKLVNGKSPSTVPETGETIIILFSVLLATSFATMIFLKKP